MSLRTAGSVREGEFHLAVGVDPRATVGVS